MLFHSDIIQSKEKVLKKKNSQIENKFFDKTRYYVIAVGTRSLSSVGKKHASDSTQEIPVRAYIYFNGYICFYNLQGKAYNKNEYIKYIDFVKNAVDKKIYEWTHFFINKGQIIRKDSRNKIVVNNEIIPRFNYAMKVTGSISEMTVRMYYDCIKSAYGDNLKDFEPIEQSYNLGTLRHKIERSVRNMSNKKLLDTDGEIIIRTTIEGYNYILDRVKKILKSFDDCKIEDIENFFARIFYLEMYGYILKNFE